MKIAIHQRKPKLLDFSHNTQKIIEASQDLTADLHIFPELFLSGYSPQDYLLHPECLEASEKSLEQISKQATSALIFGLPLRLDNRLVNALSFITPQGENLTLAKSCLPHYWLFDEKRYFHEMKQKRQLISYKHTKIACFICEEFWQQANTSPLEFEDNPDLLVVINASPFRHGIHKKRLEQARKLCLFYKSPLVYCNLVGGQDEMVFDGRSFCLDAHGQVITQLAFAEEDSHLIDTTNLTPQKTPQAQYRSFDPEETLNTLVLGTQDFLLNNGLNQVVLGLSGGIDSGLVLAIVSKILPAESIQAFYLPSAYSSELSTALVSQLSANFSLEVRELSIKNLVDTSAATLGFINQASLTEQNLQARLRAILLLAASNAIPQSIVINTSNKSEIATGYSTIYGDSIGGYSPLKDVYKTQVYELANYWNKSHPQKTIPQEILTRPPTAELKPQQTDQDSLPDYAIIDRFFEDFLGSKKSTQELDNLYSQAIREKLLTFWKINEYKRHQFPPGPNISESSFGRLAYRYPISTKTITFNAQ